MEIFLIALLTVVASLVGTITGFGTSTIMVPVLLLWLPLSTTLFLVGVIHWFLNMWRVALFRGGFEWKLVLSFGVPGIFFAWVGARLVFAVQEELLSAILGILLIFYTIFLLLKPSFKLKPTVAVAAVGGGTSGFLAGIFGIGGAVRSAFLTAFDLRKTVYLATAGAVGLAIDSARVVTYWLDGASLGGLPVWSFLVFIPASFASAFYAKKAVVRIPQESFRVVVALMLLVVGAKLLLFP